MRLIIFLSVIALVLSSCGSPSTPPATQAENATQTAPAPASSSTPDLPKATVTPAPNGPSKPGTFPDPTAYKWAPVVSGLVSPTDIQFPDDGSGRMFILEQAGKILVAKDGQLASTPFLDIEDKVGSAGNEQGLLGLAFHRNFSANPYFYINYTDVSGNTVIARFQANGDAADPASQKDLIRLDQPFPNHNGGMMVFGPDGYLYAGLGDGGSSGDPFGNAQNKDVLLGKILRIDVDHGDPYAIPADNPFGNEVWEYGLRNPWRFSFDKNNGDLYIGDVGQDAWEEVDYVPVGQGGLDFGWSYFEGSHIYKGQPPATLTLTSPVDDYSHASSRCSITGGYVYRGSMPEWQGIYFYGDYCSGEMRGMVRSKDPSSKTGWASKILYQTKANITTFGEDPAGEIYFASRAGTIYELQK